MILSAFGSATEMTKVPNSALVALGSGEIAGLDGLRALAILSVMVAHYGFGSIVPGGLGVTLFFFVSGFLITILMLREAHATGGIAIGRFYARRALRLQPELWALLLISGVAGTAFGNWPGILDWLGGLFYVSNYAQIGAFSDVAPAAMRWPHLWSLAVEEHYYVTYPLLFVLLFKVPARLMAVLTAVLIGALCWRFWLYGAGVGSDYIYAATQTRIDSIAYGCICALALWYLPIWLGDFVGANRTAIGSFAFAVLLATIVVRNPFFRDTLRYTVQGLALVLLFASLYVGKTEGWIVTSLDHPILKWVGRMSYAAYLWHIEIGHGIERLLGLPSDMGVSITSAVLAPVSIILTFAVAWVSYELFQKPVLALRRRFGAEERVKIALGIRAARATSEPVPAEVSVRQP